MNLKKIGQYIQTKRKALGLTQAELAERLGMSNKSVSKWERGVCLPDVSIYMELCKILDISLNEFIAGEDLTEDRIIEKSEENLVEVTKDGIKRRAKLKSIIIALCVVVALIGCAAGYYFYPVLFPKTNYLEPLPEDSNEIKMAEEWFGIGTAYLYNYSVDGTFDSVKFGISLYEDGVLIYDENVVEFSVGEEGRDSYLTMFHDSLDDEAKIRTSIGTFELPMSDELEKMLSASSSGRTTVADITPGKKIGLACFMYDERNLLGYSVEDIESGILPTENDYTYYLTVTFS